jgi:lipoprotein signal peptidase
MAGFIGDWPSFNLFDKILVGGPGLFVLFFYIVPVFGFFV